MGNHETNNSPNCDCKSILIGAGESFTCSLRAWLLGWTQLSGAITVKGGLG